MKKTLITKPPARHKQPVDNGPRWLHDMSPRDIDDLQSVAVDNAREHLIARAEARKYKNEARVWKRFAFGMSMICFAMLTYIIHTMQ